MLLYDSSILFWDCIYFDYPLTVLSFIIEWKLKLLVRKPVKRCRLSKRLQCSDTKRSSSQMYRSEGLQLQSNFCKDATWAAKPLKVPGKPRHHLPSHPRNPDLAVYLGHSYLKILKARGSRATERKRHMMQECGAWHHKQGRAAPCKPHCRTLSWRQPAALWKVTSRNEETGHHDSGKGTVT